MRASYKRRRNMANIPQKVAVIPNIPKKNSHKLILPSLSLLKIRRVYL
jgi:hypothetical protein